MLLSMTALEIYQALQDSYVFSGGWPQGKWPLSRRFNPHRLEVVVGAILTQNTNWKNVERALGELIRQGLLDAGAIAACALSRLERAVRSSGFYRQKARRLKETAGFMVAFPGNFYRNVRREQLLSINGIGPETADSILLYACHRPHFVVDAYTRRVFTRYGLLKERASYAEIQKFFQSRLPRDVDLYQRYHALIVEHAKQTCKKLPLCGQCVLNQQCAAAQRTLRTVAG